MERALAQRRAELASKQAGLQQLRSQEAVANETLKTTK